VTGIRGQYHMLHVCVEAISVAARASVAHASASAASQARGTLEAERLGDRETDASNLVMGHNPLRSACLLVSWSACLTPATTHRPSSIVAHRQIGHRMRQSPQTISVPPTSDPRSGTISESQVANTTRLCPPATSHQPSSIVYRPSSPSAARQFVHRLSSIVAEHSATLALDRL